MAQFYFAVTKIYGRLLKPSVASACCSVFLPHNSVSIGALHISIKMNIQLRNRNSKYPINIFIIPPGCHSEKRMTFELVDQNYPQCKYQSFADPYNGKYSKA